MSARTIVIMGAAGRDFHNFNCVFRDDPGVRVAAFTATQIPDIAGRRYPPDLAGKLYPEGIPIVAESDLESLFRGQRIEVDGDMQGVPISGAGGTPVSTRPSLEAGSDSSGKRYHRGRRPLIRLSA